MTLIFVIMYFGIVAAYIVLGSATEPKQETLKALYVIITNTIEPTNPIGNQTILSNENSFKQLKPAA